MYRESSGFTLIELIIVVAIAGILLSVGVPYMTTMTANSAANQASGLLEKDLLFARNTAATKSRNINVVPVNDEYENGWQVIDTSDNTVLRDRAEMRAAVNITTNEYDSDNPVVFSATGGVTQAGTIVICTENSAGDANKSLSILPSGQVLFGTANCGS